MSGGENGSAGCNCIAKVDEMLAARNTRLMLPIMLGDDQTPRLMIVTDQIQSGRGKQKACGMFATFCPFCGTAYAERARAKPIEPTLEQRRAEHLRDMQEDDMGGGPYG